MNQVAAMRFCMPSDYAGATSLRDVIEEPEYAVALPVQEVFKLRLAQCRDHVRILRGYEAEKGPLNPHAFHRHHESKVFRPFEIRDKFKLVEILRRVRQIPTHKAQALEGFGIPHLPHTQGQAKIFFQTFHDTVFLNTSPTSLSSYNYMLETYNAPSAAFVKFSRGRVPAAAHPAGGSAWRIVSSSVSSLEQLIILLTLPYEFDSKRLRFLVPLTRSAQEAFQAFPNQQPRDVASAALDASDAWGWGLSGQP
jgi:hypothetical protein